jgi:23S rRNA-/tRNA-specific pseudouridylate synthase
LCEIGFPLVVDAMYGRRRALALSEIKRDYRRKPGHLENPLIERMTLHALAIEFPDPADASDAAPSAASADPRRAHRRIRVESPIPRDIARVLKQLAKVRAW